ncbi:MAG: c-type cytochrome [Acidobacteria bacterium]|nr:c-type cytochrome [Acidobacteriota bacterium]
MRTLNPRLPARLTRLAWPVATLGLLAMFGAASATAQDHAGQYEQANIEFGARLYGANCVRCHGEGGTEVPGIDLSTGSYARAESDPELMQLIRTGIRGTAMPPNDFSASELTGIVSYLRTMRDFDLSAVTLGDAARGQTLFSGKGACASCHRVRGQGPRTAPDLTAIGATRTAADLQNAMLDPTGSMIAVNRPVRAVLGDGTVINGRRLNEDTYTIQLIDENERLRSFDKADLRELAAVTTSPMPPATDALNEQEIGDVLAYLLTLKGMD